MLNEERIRMMFQIARYEQGAGSRDLKICKYTEKDYTAFSMIKNFFLATMTYLLLLGLMVLGTPIMHMLFPSTDYIISGRLLMFGGVAVIFYALSTITNAALQGLDKMNLPVIHSAVSLGIHVLLVVVLLRFTDLGIYALLIGTVTYPLVVCILNWISVNKYAHYRQEIIRPFVIPLTASAVMAGITALTRMLLTGLAGDSYAANFITVVICIIIAVLVYFAVIFLMKGLTHEDMLDFPMGLRIERLAKKLRLMR